MADYDVKVRLEGKPDDVMHVSRQLRRIWWVLDESRNYPNRTRAGFVRRYLSIVLRFDRHPVDSELSRLLDEVEASAISDADEERLLQAADEIELIQSPDGTLGFFFGPTLHDVSDDASD